MQKIIISSQIRRGLGLGGLLLLGIGGWQYQRLEKQQARQQQEQREIINKTDSLCQAFIPSSQPLHYLAEKQLLRNKAGQTVSRWAVTGLSASGQEVAYFLWNADQDSLLSFSWMDAPRKGIQTDSPSSFEQERLVRLAWSWLQRLGTSAGKWRLVEEPRAVGESGVWQVQALSEDQKVALTIHRNTGALIAFSHHPLPPAVASEPSGRFRPAEM